ncbi:hypothetical protein [Alkalibacillus haloalkaliphilus]|uniref:hypothetical protein n=1 Tax=Alkalibacillus haloalkaliphilus TaxID=94136 RepID=UPI0029365288|nr:hypothetical protein [Alkalibacillus haloalkaliphilus]MDV2581588.1 hypothetical protein [Alkalibacillus haloalkaliphilus]
MQTNALFYKIQKGIVSVEDYVNWSFSLLEKNVSSPSLNIIASLSQDENIFEVEDYFKKALTELGIQHPTFETSARGYIAYLASDILECKSLPKKFELAYKIFRIVMEIQYPKDLMEWFHINEMVDQLRYDNLHIEFNEKDVKSKIENEAKFILESNK